MIRSRYPLVSLLVFLTLTTAAGAVDKKKMLSSPPPKVPEPGQSLQAEWEKREKLRKMVSLPRMTVLIGYGVNGRGEFENQADLLPDPDKTVQIEKGLRGDETDAESYSRLALLYSRVNQPARAKEARLKAVELFRKQLGQHPDDTAIQLHLADALDRIDKSADAEALVRRAIEEHPNDWHAWLALAELLQGNSWGAILGHKPFHFSSPETLVQSIRAAQPTPERIAASQQYRREAIACFDRAARIAPRESEVYRRRGASRYCYGLLDVGLRMYKGEKAEIIECFLGREALPDLRQAVELNPQEYKGIGMVAFVESMTEIYDRRLRDPSTKPPKKLIDGVSQSTRRRVLEDIGRLEKGTLHLDKHKAAEAFEVLGYLQLFFLEDNTAAGQSARRSIELEPKREAAWDVLSGCLLATKEFAKLAAVCRERLTHKNSARNCFLLAKAYEYLDQIDKAEEVVRTALQREPDDFMLRLTLADLLLMRGNPENLQEAGQMFYKMRGDKLSDGGSENRWANFTFAVGIYRGLIGKSDEAQNWLKTLQKRHPQYSGVADALKALEE